jgi:hypothetical protein
LHLNSLVASGMFCSVWIRFVNVVNRSEHYTGCFYVFILCKCRDWVVCVPTIAIAMATFLTSAFLHTWHICGEERYHVYILQQAPFQSFARTLQKELIPECYHSVSHVLQQGMLAAQLFPVLLGSQTGTMLEPLIFGRWRDTLVFSFVIVVRVLSSTMSIWARFCVALCLSKVVASSLLAAFGCMLLPSSSNL